MTTIDRSALLMHPATHIYELVADIERYPDFLSGCVDAQILERDVTTVQARLGLSRAGISHSFVTRNTMQPHDLITLTLVDGPFEQFAGEWRFKALGADACKVSLTLDFRLRSGLINAAAGRLFDKVALDLVDAIVKRAGVIYGKQPV